MTELLEAALAYAARGWPVLPLHTPKDGRCDCGKDCGKDAGKHPRYKKGLLEHGLKDATTDPEAIRRWWGMWPTANIGIATGAASGLVVVDLDGPEAVASLNGKHLPPSPCVITARGEHRYFRHPGFPCRNFVRKLPGLDFRGDGGYVVAPSSLHSSGRRYGWADGLSPDDVDLAPCTNWLMELLRAEKDGGEPKAAAPLPDVIPEGARNSTLTSLAGTMQRRGASGEAITAALLTENQARCSPPLEREEVERIAESVSRYEPEAADQGGRVFPLTDLGNSERLIAAHAANLRYDVDSGKWLHWTGKFWQPDATGAVDRLAREVIRSMCDFLKTAASKAERDELYAHIKKSESAPRLAAMVDLARYCPGVPVQSKDLDADSTLFNCENGTVDLRTGRLREHSQADLITKLAPVKYDPAAGCPRWLLFLEEIFAGDAEVIGFVQRMCGYLLTGDTLEHAVFVCSGKGSNGKTVMVETLRGVLGDYAKDTPIVTFTDRHDANTSDLADLTGARMVTASEGEEAQSFNESLLKRLSGGDPITCRHLYREYSSYVPTFKVLFCTNEIPRIRSQNLAMKRRIKLISFRVTFYDRQDGREPVRDEGLLAKLLAERSGILSWAVEGCLQWQRHGLMTPAAVRLDVDKLFESQDPLGEFLDERCQIEAGLMVEVARLWRLYLEWCDGNGRAPVFKQPSSFSRSLQQRDGIDGGRDMTGLRVLTGIGFCQVLADKEHFPINSLMKDLHGKVIGNGRLSDNTRQNELGDTEDPAYEPGAEG